VRKALGLFGLIFLFARRIVLVRVIPIVRIVLVPSSRVVSFVPAIIVIVFLSPSSAPASGRSFIIRIISIVFFSPLVIVIPSCRGSIRAGRRGRASPGAGADRADIP
jgi:hypothetical protein